MNLCLYDETKENNHNVYNLHGENLILSDRVMQHLQCCIFRGARMTIPWSSSGTGIMVSWYHGVLGG